jgi:hypothetical protein
MRGVGQKDLRGRPSGSEDLRGSLKAVELNK